MIVSAVVALYVASTPDTSSKSPIPDLPPTWRVDTSMHPVLRAPREMDPHAFGTIQEYMDYHTLPLNSQLRPDGQRSRTR